MRSEVKDLYRMYRKVLSKLITKTLLVRRHTTKLKNIIDLFGMNMMNSTTHVKTCQFIVKSR